MRILLGVLFMGLLLFSFPIIKYFSPVSAETTEPCGTCENPDDVADCVDKQKCPSYQECYDCCRKTGAGHLGCRTVCREAWDANFPTTSDVAKIVLTLLIVGSAIYLMRKRISLVKS